MPLTFRDATRDDIAAILMLSYEGAAAPGMNKPPEPDSPATLSAFEAIDTDPNHRLIVAVEDGLIVGTLQISYIPGIGHNGLWRGQIEYVHIRSDRRGNGLGGTMMQWAIDRCREPRLRPGATDLEQAQGRRPSLLRTSGVRKVA